MLLTYHLKKSYSRFSVQSVAYGIILFACILLNLDLILHKGIPTTFDGHIHITTAVQYAQILKSIEIPSWFQGFANYGYPLSLVAHQSSAFFGAALIIIGLEPHQVFKIIIFASTVMSGWGMFWFLDNLLRKNLRAQDRLVWAALCGALMWIFSHYRIMNIYSRGAIPELFVSALLPILLFQISTCLARPNTHRLILLAFLSGLLVLTHPMAIITAMPLVVACILSWVSVKKSALRNIFLVSCMGVLGIVMAAYYLFPLVIESKYFYQGSSLSEIGLDTFLDLKNVFVVRWPYFSLTDHPGPRVGPIPVGLVEFFVYLVGVGYALLLVFKRKFHRSIGVWVFAASLSLFLSTTLSAPFYAKLSFLSSLQYPWRFLLPFHFSASVLTSLLLAQFRMQRYSILALLTILVAMRLPEAYGKNYVDHDVAYYSFTKENLHSTNLNPRWVGETKEYPKQESLLSVIEGTAVVEVINEKASNRSYAVTAKNPVRISFNTFYFPGWRIYLDGIEQVIEYQDPDYRGVMTFEIPEGSYRIDVKYGDTKVRFVSKLISLAAVGLAIGIYLTKKGITSQGD